MNQVTETIMNHRSIRSYENKPLADHVLDAILAGVQAGPTSINGQQLSVIVIKDQSKLDKIDELCGGQAWISEAPVFLLFVADFYKAKLAAQKHNQPLEITKSLESIMVGSVDVGIGMTNAMTIAESFGLGTVPIGAVRRDPETLIDLLDLPELVFPVVGLVVGHPKDMSHKKPRMPKEAFVHYETYNRDMETCLDEYDETISTYMLERTKGESDRSWSQTTSSIYNSVYFPKVYPIIKKQGFSNNC